jgi:hypothetical protein
VLVGVLELVDRGGDGAVLVERGGVAPAFAERQVEGADHRAAQFQLYVVPRWVVAVRGRHLHRLRVAAVVGAVAAAVAQVDAAGERDVQLGAAGVAQDHHFLVV